MKGSPALELQPVKIAGIRSLWLQQALASESTNPRGCLIGNHRCDACIVGGGYTGLWTALRIKELDPSIEVTILEADICGGGASGRNGGLALAWWPKLPALVSLFGKEEGVRLARASSEAISTIGEVCRSDENRAAFGQHGHLRTAAAPAQLGKWETAVRTTERLGLDVYQRLTTAEVQDRAGSSVYLGGVLEKDGATVQPAFLARHLARLAESQGVTIFEESPLTTISPATPHSLSTPSGVVTAETVILAINAWAGSIPELRNGMVVVSSDMVATAPAASRIAATGWNGGEAITDGRLMVHYHQVTADGRIAIGRGTGALTRDGQVTETFNRSQQRAEPVIRGLHYLYPELADIPITHTWAGPIDRTRSSLLAFGTIGMTGSIHYGFGYSGTGVAPSVVGGKILASRALGRKDEWTESPLNRPPMVEYPPDRIKYFGGLLVRSQVYRKEEAEQQGHTPGRLRRVIANQAIPRLPEH